MMNESFLGIFDDDVSDAPPPASRQPSWAGPPSPGVLPASPGLNVQRQPSWADLPEGAPSIADAWDSVPLPSTLVFDHPTARQVALHLRGNQPTVVGARGVTAAAVSAGAEVRVAGLSVALPGGVSSVGALRELSHGGRDLLRVIPSCRWDVEEAAEDLRATGPAGGSAVSSERESCDEKDGKGS